MLNQVQTPIVESTAASSMDVQLLAANEQPVVLDLNHWIPANCSDLLHAFIVSLSVIVVSELGDKTFFITAIMAMKNSRLVVFFASSLALFVMTMLSVGMGVAVTVVPRLYTHYASIILFFCFGLKMMKEAYDMNEDGSTENSEYTEAKKEIEERYQAKTTKKAADENVIEEENFASCETSDLTMITTGASKQLEADQCFFSKFCPSMSNLKQSLLFAPVVINIFTMIFVAEWGDRSQLSTIILAAKEDATGVFVGSFFGHVLCTGLAVIGGRFIAEMISVRTMNFIGSVVFLLFGIYGLCEIMLFHQLDD